MVLFTDYIKIKKLTVKEYLEKNINNECIPIELIKCTCCLNHKNKFPVNINYVLNLQSKKICKCPCRHLSRYIYRQINKSEPLYTFNYGDNNEPDESDDSDETYKSGDSESLGSEDTDSNAESEESEESEESDSFIENDSGMSKRTRRDLDKIKKILQKGFIDNLKKME